MADRSIVVRLRAEVDGFTRAMGDATKAVERTAKGSEDSAKRASTAMGRMVQSAQENRQAWNTAGTTLTAFGAAALGGLGLAVKGAMDWESAWAGVLKTVDGTPAQLNAIEEGLRGMARELPASHAEIAAVAEAAGQLGIETPNVLGFTRTMIDMGEATNMSAETAAMSLARFMNITQTSQADVGRLGATIVGLGNNFASTESEIVEMSQRLAGAGAQAGMSEGEIMGMATALSSVGIEAQAGGSALSRTMTTIGMEVDTGGDKLETFAMVAGMSAEQFATAWREDPARALDAFVAGLSETERMGMSTNQVLSELGITAIRESDALRRLAGSGGVLTNAMAMGNAEWEKGTALIEEAAQRYETAESRIAMAKNALVDMGISVGQVVLPAFANLADGAADVFGWFADLPGPVHAVAGGLAGVAGAASLGAGAFLLTVPRVLDTVSAFRDLGAISPGTASRVGRVTLGIGKVGLAAGVAAAAFPILVSGARALEDSLKGIDRASLDIGMNEMAARTLDAADATSVYDAVLGDLANSGALNTDQFDNLGVAVDKVANMDAFGRIGNQMGLAAGGWDLMADRFELFGDSLAMIAQTDLPAAQESFAGFWAEAEAGGASFEDVLSVMPAFKDELQGIANLMGVDATDNAILLKIATGELSPVIDEATGAVTGFEEGMEGAAEATQSVAEAAQEAITAMSELAGEFITAERAAMDYADALDETNDLVKENGKAWEDGTEAGDENKRMLLDLADQAWATADALSAEGKSGTFLEGAREDLIDVATEMIGSREEAEKYVDQLLGTPAEIETIVKLEADAAREEWDALWDELGYHPPLVIDPEVDPDDKVPQFTGLISDIPPETNTDVNVETDEAAEKAWGFAGVLDETTAPREVPIEADTLFGEQQLRDFQVSINEAGGTVTINGDEMNGQEALDFLVGNIDSASGIVTINGEDYPATISLSELISAINSSDGTVTIEGNNNPANSATNSAVGHANRSTGTIKVGAATSAANSAINHAARTRYSTISVSYSVRGGVPQMNFGNGTRATARAMGGPVFGPGSGTSDSIPALLSNGEHVITAKEVAMAGGQDAIYKMREAIRSGFRFANGGAVDGGGQSVSSRPVPPVVMRVSSSDGANVGQSVASALSSWQPVVNIGGREFAGVMMQGNQRINAMGGRR